MKIYYLKAIEKGDSSAMYNLGIYYENTEKNYFFLKK
jgi:TPR repeat protein